MKRTILALALLCLPAAGFSEGGGDDPVMRALTKELERSFSGLRKAEKVPLYYLGYELASVRSGRVSAKLGALEGDSESPSARLTIDVRVGEPALDNTHQVKGENPALSFPQAVDYPLSLEGGEDALRARIWEYTDASYKKAQESYTKVRMNKAVTAAEEDPSPDFSPAPPEVFYETAELGSPDLEAWRLRLRRLSSVFAPHPFIYDSGVSLSWENENRYLANSDGTRVKTGRNHIFLIYTLSSRTTDGMEVSRYVNYYGDSFDDLPEDAKILADMERSIAELKALKDAPVVEPYSGPVILRDRASGVYFHEIIGHRLEGHRQKLEDSGQTFAKKVGQKVTSEIINLYDDASLPDFRGRPLRGHYKYDNEGVKSRRVNLIENGVLKGFLMSRSPVRGFASSNGHGRRAPGLPAVSRMGNLVLEPSKTVPFAELRRMLTEECKKQGKSFGLLIDDIYGGLTSIGRSGGQSFKVLPLLTYKVYVDGRPDEVVRGVNIVGTPLVSLGKVLAASDDYEVRNSNCGAESGFVPVSSVAPSLLFSELEVEKSEKSQQKPPVLPPPLHGK